MPKVIEGSGRDIILKVKRACEEERANKGPIVPFSKVRSRVAFLTGVSERTVTQITKEGNIAAATNAKLVTPGKTRNRKRKIDDIDEFDKCTIRHVIQSFYIEKKEIPTLNKLLSELKADIDFKFGKTSLRRILKSMGYTYRKCQHSNRKVLIERSDVAASRAKYILSLRKNRQNKNLPVIYLKFWQSDEQPGILACDSLNARWIIAHAGSKTGFVENGLILFKSKSKSSDTNSTKELQWWVGEKIVPSLPSNCIVVMDNASYRCTQIKEAPTIDDTKAELQDWLTKNSIHYDDCWTKAQLHELVKDHKGDPQNEIEKILNEHGHEVLCLPPFHSDLNPIEKIWAIVKTRIAHKNGAQDPSEIAKITYAAFRTVTIEEWLNECLRVEKLEDKYFESERLMDVEMDKGEWAEDDQASSEDEEDSYVPKLYLKI